MRVACLTTIAACDPGDRTAVHDGPAFTLDGATAQQAFEVLQCGSILNRTPTVNTAMAYVDPQSEVDRLQVRVAGGAVDVVRDEGSVTFDLPSLSGGGTTCGSTLVEFSAATDTPIDVTWIVELRDAGPNPMDPRQVSVAFSAHPPA